MGGFYDYTEIFALDNSGTITVGSDDYGLNNGVYRGAISIYGTLDSAEITNSGSISSGYWGIYSDRGVTLTNTVTGTIEADSDNTFDDDAAFYGITENDLSFSPSIGFDFTNANSVFESAQSFTIDANGDLVLPEGTYQLSGTQIEVAFVGADNPLLPLIDIPATIAQTAGSPVIFQTDANGLVYPATINIQTTNFGVITVNWVSGSGFTVLDANGEPFVQLNVTPGFYDDTIDNAGLLDGDVITGLGDDSVTNSGTIMGLVELGTGNDSYVETGSGTGLAFIMGGEGDDIITVLNGFHELSGDAGDDIITGGTGEDRIFGGEGADTIDGGAGNDRSSYFDSDAGVTVSLVAGVVGSGGHAQGDTLTNIENLVGSDFNDTLTGNAEDNILSGRDGDDTIIGGAGDDEITGGSGDNTLTGGTGADVFVFEDFASDFDGEITDLDQDDTLQIFQELSAVSDFSTLFIGDAVFGSVAGQIRYEKTGGETLLQIDEDGDGVADGTLTISNGEFDLMIAGQASGEFSLAINPVITGTENDDILIGTSGDDAIFGLGGNDIIIGGAGSDTIDGGAGNDDIRIDLEDDYADIIGGAGTDTLRFVSLTGEQLDFEANGFEIGAMSTVGGDLWKVFQMFTPEISRETIYDFDASQDYSIVISDFNSSGTGPFASRSQFRDDNNLNYQIDFTFNDGTRRLEETDTNSNDPWATRVTEFAANGEEQSSLTVFDNSDTVQFTFDVDDTESWAFREIRTDVSGTKSYSVLTAFYTDDGSLDVVINDRDDGSRVTTDYNPDNSEPFSFSILTEDLANATSAYQSILQYRDDNNANFEVLVTYDDGGTQLTETDTDDSDPWASRVTVRDSAGLVASETTTADNGDILSFTYDLANAEDWAVREIRTDVSETKSYAVLTAFFTDSGALDVVAQLRDDGSRYTIDYDANDDEVFSASFLTEDLANTNATYASILQLRDDSNVVYEQTVTFDDGRAERVETDTNADDIWSSRTTRFDSLGNVESIYTVFDDGTIRFEETDTDNNDPYDTRLTLRDSTGAITSVLTTLDNSDTVDIVYDIADVETWSRREITTDNSDTALYSELTAFYGENGDLDVVIQDFDSGLRRTTDYDADDTEDFGLSILTEDIADVALFSSVLQLRNDANQVTSIRNEYDNLLVVTVEYDVDDTEIWFRSVTTEDNGGFLPYQTATIFQSATLQIYESNVVDNDGTRIITDFDLNDVETYDRQITRTDEGDNFTWGTIVDQRDANGNILYLSQTNDGSYDTINVYDVAGTEVWARTLTYVDDEGQYDFATRTYFYDDAGDIYDIVDVADGAM